MNNQTITEITDAKSIMIIQAENPDGDSLGSALALEEILGDMGKDITLYCPVQIPNYLRYLPGWDRVTDEPNLKADLAIIVDTSADVLLGKALEQFGMRNFLETHPVIVFDHHASESTLSFDHTLVVEEAPSASDVIFRAVSSAGWPINQQAAEHMLAALLSDTLGLSTPSVTPESYRTAASLTELGAKTSDIEDRRRQLMKKAPEILNYKAKLIERIEYFLDGKLALVHVPFEEIEEFSDKYNPGALIGEELRLVEGVVLNCVIKTYPDGKATGRLRSELPIAETVAGYFGGGGHAFAAGFRIYENYDQIVTELVTATDKALQTV